MRLDQGGHLTHGSPVSITGKIYRFVSYGVTPASDDGTGERIDFDQVRDLAKRERPALIVAGTTAYTADHRPAAVPRDRRRGRAPASCSMPRTRPGSSPVASTRARSGVADVVTFTTHKTLRGPRGGAILCGEEHAKEIDSGRVPRAPGRPARARHRGQGGGLRRGARPEFRDYAATVVANAAGARGVARGRGFPPRRRRDREPPGASSTCAPSTPSSPATGRDFSPATRGEFRCLQLRELALNWLKTHDNSPDQVTLFPPLQANLPATAGSTSPRSNVQERG